MKERSDKHGNTKSFGAATSIDELARQYSVKAPIEKRGKLVAQPRMQEEVKEASLTESRADSGGFSLDKSIAMLAVVLAFVAAVFGVSVHAINSSSNARFDDINARFDRLEASIDKRFNDIDERFNEIDARFNGIDERFNEIDARFDDLGAKVDANTEVTASLRGESVLTYRSSDSP